MQTGSIKVNVAPLPVWHGASKTIAAQTALGILSPMELKELRQAVGNRQCPEDLLNKLHMLSEGDLGLRYIALNGTLFLELLFMACQGEFELSHSDFEQILRVLAYIRKEDDAIPDFLPSGYLDDQREVRLALFQLSPVLERFKSWKLQTQVPALW